MTRIATASSRKSAQTSATSSGKRPRPHRRADTTRLATLDELDLLDWKRRVFELYAEVRAAPQPERGMASTGATCATSSFARTRRRRSRRRASASRPAATSTTTPRCACSPRSSRPSACSARSPHRASSRTRSPASRAPRFAVARPGTVPRPVLAGRVRRRRLPLLRRRDERRRDLRRRPLPARHRQGLRPRRASDGRLVLDFNFAYNPSCAYDPRWVCPLAPPGNRLPVPIRGGERYLL